MQTIWEVPETEEIGENFNREIEFNAFLGIPNWLNSWNSSPGQSWRFLLSGSGGSGSLEMPPYQCCQWILFSVSVTAPRRVPSASSLLVQKWAAPKGLGSYPENWQAGIPLPGNPRRHQSRRWPVLDICHQLCWLCIFLSQAGSQRWVLLYFGLFQWLSPFCIVVFYWGNLPR